MKRYLSYSLIGIFVYCVDRVKNAFLMESNIAPPVIHSALVGKDVKKHFYDSTSLPHQTHRVVFLEQTTNEQNQTQLQQRPVDQLSNQSLTQAQPASDALLPLLPYEKPYHHQCTFMKPWQSQFYPTCNQLHELDTTQDTTSLLAMSGSWRSVWKYTQGNESVVLKMLHLKREFNFESFGFHQVDAMALERLTKSQFVISSYGFCGQSTLVELAPKDARSLTKDESIGSKERLRMARDLARGLNHIHSIDYGEGANATLLHNDINMANIATVDMRTLKFNDFNLGVLLKWNGTQPCGYPTHFRGDLWRSPEEVRNTTYVSEKIDVYSLGNVLFQILTRHQPWTWIEPEGPLSTEEVAKRKLEGMAPTFPDRILDSDKLTHQALYYATLACYESDPAKRPTAFQLFKGLSKAYKWVETKQKKGKDEVRKIFFEESYLIQVKD